MISCRNTWTDFHDADLVQFDQVRAAIPALKKRWGSGTSGVLVLCLDLLRPCIPMQLY